MSGSVRLRQALAMAIVFLALGCSSDPDESESAPSWTDRYVEEWKNKPYPSLGDTPDRPEFSSLEERQEVLKQLENDRYQGTVTVPE